MFKGCKSKKLLKFLIFLDGKFFGDFIFGHFFCPILKRENTLWQKCICYSIIEFYRKGILIFFSICDNKKNNIYIKKYLGVFFVVKI
jgi:hypothetical protein